MLGEQVCYLLNEQVCSIITQKRIPHIGQVANLPSQYFTLALRTQKSTQKC